MKKIYTVILLLIQYLAYGQLNEWNEEVIRGNSIKTALVHLKVPETNPSHFEEPKGKMLLRKTEFDRSGRVTRELCVGCLFITHDGSYDVTREYFYRNEKLTRIEQTDKFQKTTLFYYDDLQIMECKLDSNNNRLSVKISDLDSSGMVLTSTGIEWEFSWIEDDMVHQVYIDRIEYYYHSDTMLESKHYDLGTTNMLDIQTYKTLREAEEPRVIKELLRTLRLNFQDSPLIRRFAFDQKGNLKAIYIGDKADPKIKYIRTEDGLIKELIRVWPAYTREENYSYNYY